VYVVPGRDSSGSKSASTSQPRFVGNVDMTSRPSVSTRHRSSGEDTPPGKRHDMPTTTIGSSVPDPDRAAAPVISGREPTSSARRNPARAAGDG
jgi:hypothetical protein